MTQLGFWVLSFEVEEEGERGDIEEKNEEEREPPPPTLQRSSTAGSSKKERATCGALAHALSELCIRETNALEPFFAIKAHLNAGRGSSIRGQSGRPSPAAAKCQKP